MHKFSTYNNAKNQSPCPSVDDYLHDYCLVYESVRSQADLLPPPVQWQKSLTKMFEFCSAGPLLLLGAKQKQNKALEETKKEDDTCNDYNHKSNQLYTKSTQKDASSSKLYQKEEEKSMDINNDYTEDRSSVLIFTEEYKRCHYNNNYDKAADVDESESRPTTEIIIPFQLNIEGGCQQYDDRVHGSDCSTCSTSPSVITFSSCEDEEGKEDECHMAFYSAKRNSVTNHYTKQQRVLFAPSVQTFTSSSAIDDDHDVRIHEEAKHNSSVKRAASAAKRPLTGNPKAKRATMMVSALPPGVKLYSRIAQNMAMSPGKRRTISSSGDGEDFFNARKQCAIAATATSGTSPPPAATAAATTA